MNKLLVGIFFVALAVLLISAKFGFVFAGGNGYVKSFSAIVEVIDGRVDIERVDKIRTAEVGDSVSRGEKISTGEKSRALIRIGHEITIAVDEQTDIILEQLFPSQVEIKIIRGRLVANTSPEIEKLIVSSPKASGQITEGSITVVRYDFLEKTTYVPIDTKALIDIPEATSFSASDRQAVDVYEINPQQSNYSEFSFEALGEENFYEWAGSLNLRALP